jgi:hypothetical protein
MGGFGARPTSVFKVDPPSLLWVQGVPSSNLGAPTNKNSHLRNQQKGRKPPGYSSGYSFAERSTKDPLRPVIPRCSHPAVRHASETLRLPVASLARPRGFGTLLATSVTIPIAAATAAAFSVSHRLKRKGRVAHADLPLAL